MKSLQISPPNFVINIRFFNIFITIFFGAILHQSKDDAPKNSLQMQPNSYPS
jgi:hypothetical protein